MSAGFDADFFERKDAEPTSCNVVSIYGDAGGRDMLVRLCDSLSHRFQNDMDFRFGWWRFKYLKDPEISIEAAHSAARADLLLVAPQSQELPTYVQTWFEGWMPNRGDVDGALVLVQSSEKGPSHSLSMRTYLNLLAKRSRLDYFRLDSPRPAVDQSFFARKLRSIAEENDQPTHWGINE